MATTSRSIHRVDQLEILARLLEESCSGLLMQFWTHEKQCYRSVDDVFSSFDYTLQL